MARPLKPRTPLGERLIAAREELGFRKRDGFAERLGVPADTLGTYERGVAAPSPDLFATYRREFGVNVNWLVTGEGDMFDDPSKARARPLDNDLLDRLGRAALQVYGEMKRSLPDARVAGEAALLYNDLVELGVDLHEADAIEAAIPLLQHRMRRRLELAASDPSTDKRLA